MNEPVEDKELIDYLHRKSALSMGYRKVYLEAPPPEVDRAIKARARRALRWLGPALLSVGIAFFLISGLTVGVGNFMTVLVQADRRNKEALRPPITVAIDASTLQSETPANEGAAKNSKVERLTREQWLAKIAALKKSGKQAEAEAEQQRLDAAYPPPPKIK